MKEKFIEIYTNNIKREGADKLLEWLLGSDFFTAPASTRHHLAYKGGLVEHSLNVFDNLEWDNLETKTICGLLHDVCKVNLYKEDIKNVKVDGKWEQQPYYTYDEKFPFGHGEKSVFLIERFMRLNIDEAIAVRFHMGAYEGEKAWNNVSKAFKEYPLAFYLHFADMKSTYIDEGR